MKNTLQNLGTELLYETAGSILFALGVHNFAIAAQLPLTGISGIAYVLNYLTGISMGWAVILLNIPVALLCFRMLGKGFFFRSVRCMLISSLMIDYLAPLLPVYQGDRLLASLAAGVTMGLGMAVIYLRNTSTGGIDFITMSVKTKFPYLPLGKILLLLDGVVVCVSSAIFRDVDGLIYGFIVSFLCSVVVDKAIFGINSGKMALIVTERGREICQVIEDTCHRGSTLLAAAGGYRGEKKSVVVSVCSTKQMVEVQQAVKRTDPAAFTIILESNEVHGAGFRTVQFGDQAPKPAEDG